MVKIKRHGKFDQMLEKLCNTDEEMHQLVEERIIWFRRNPNDTRLRNHVLTKSMEGKWAFSITGDIRIIYEWKNKTTVRFLTIGPHTTVYKKN